MTVTTSEEVAAGTVFLAVVGVGWAALARRALRRRRTERRATRRARQVEAASVEASLENEAFAPQKIRADVDAILRLAAHEPDLVAAELDSRPDAPLISAWRRAHRLKAGASVQHRPSVDLLRLVNRGNHAEDCVVAGYTAGSSPPAVTGSSPGRHGGLMSAGTLARGATGWRLLEFDAHPLADGLLDTPVIAGAWADRERLNEQSLAGLAQPPGATPVRVGDLVNRDAQPYAQLLDLSLVDGRFLPALIEAALKHLIEVWEQATLVSTDSLEQRADSAVCEQLLRPLIDDRSMRLVLRDAVLRSWEPTSVEADGNHVTPWCRWSWRPSGMSLTSSRPARPAAPTTRTRSPSSGRLS